MVENSQYEEEFKDFLEIIYKAECFLQVRAYFVETKDFMNSSLKSAFGTCMFPAVSLKNCSVSNRQKNNKCTFSNILDMALVSAGMIT